MTGTTLVPTRIPDCFISFGSGDRPFAESVKAQLDVHGLDVFLAPVSLSLGEHWSPATLDALRNSKWVLFLASREACRSPYVQQEVGGAILTRKSLVPVVWDMSPSELPAWSNQHQALDIRGMTIEQIALSINSLGQRIRQDRDTGRLVGLALMAALFYLVLKD